MAVREPFTFGETMPQSFGTQQRREVIRIVAPSGSSLLAAGINAALHETPGLLILPPGRSGFGRPELPARPDVFLVEDRLLLPAPEVLATSNARPHSPWVKPARVVVLMRDADAGRIVAYLQLGVRAFVCHDASLDDLLGAVRAAAREEAYLPPGIAQRVIEGILPYLPCFEAGEELPVHHLTAREREIFHLMTAGRSNAEIASVCALSLKTVKFHVSNILRKLGMKNRVQAIAQARRTLRASA